MLEFEWDEAKACSNLCKHGVSFQDAAEAFSDPMLLELEPQADAQGELRFAILAGRHGVVLYVAYTERNDRIRIISARKATRHEARRYEEGHWI
jgi:uncharacterized DUF497 family protein